MVHSVCLDASIFLHCSHDMNKVHRRNQQAMSKMVKVVLLQLFIEVSIRTARRANADLFLLRVISRSLAYSAKIVYNQCSDLP